MKFRALNTIQTLLVVVVLFLGASCKSQYEKIRASGDVKTMLVKANEYYDKGKYLEAQGLYELLISSLRGNKDAETVFYRYAYTHYYLDKFTTASYYFKNFAQSYPRSEFREEADYMSAYAEYKQSPTFRLDQTPTNKAVEAFQLFINTYPSSTRVKECNKLIDEMRTKLEVKAFEEGNLYYHTKEYQSAIRVYDNLLKDFPETEKAERVRLQIVLSYYDFANNSILSKQEERYKGSVEACDDYLAKFPKGDYRKEVAEILKESKKALKYISKQPISK
jgi:outer membrane protein assembly factor BamD